MNRKKFTLSLLVFVVTALVMHTTKIFQLRVKTFSNNYTSHFKWGFVKTHVLLQNISQCTCLRQSVYPRKSDNRLNSSCSDEGTTFDSNQLVVSFSLRIPSGRNKKKISKQDVLYYDGLRENLKMMRVFYPGYTLRLYTNLPLAGKYCQLVCENVDFFWCNMTNIPSHGDLTGMDFRSWRFLPLGDPTVDVFLSRDLDSLISSREADVVGDWLHKGDKAISIMRDRAGGHNHSILGGMWEANNTILGMKTAGELRQKIIDASMKKGRNSYGYDMKVLAKIIFDTRSQDIVAYDSFNCEIWSNYTLVRPFPTQRQDPNRDFVGNRVDFGGTGERKKYGADVCPVACRPEYGKDWVYC